MSAELRCTATPISWLRLEQHHAGEIAGSERAAIDAHLADCAACAACLERIVADASVPLTALTAPTASPAPGPAPAPAPPVRPAALSFLRRAGPPLGALALAAGVLLFLGRDRGRPRPSDLDPTAARTKGGDVALVLVRDDDRVVAEAGGVYRDGDRWKALVTCPAGMRASWDLVAYEHGVAGFPLAPTAELVCGNDVPLRGAFRTTGRERMTVCLVWDDGAPVDREALRRAAPDALMHASCKVLEPAP